MFGKRLPRAESKGYRGTPQPLLYHQLRSTLLTILFAVTALGWLIYFVSERVVVDTVVDSLKYHAQFRINRIESMYEVERQALQQVANSRALRAALHGVIQSRPQQQTGDDWVYMDSTEAIQQIYHQTKLGSIRRELSLVINKDLLLFDLQGRFMTANTGDRYLISHGERLDELMVDTPSPLARMIQQVRQTGQAAVSRYGFSEISERSMAWIGVPVYSPYRKEILAVLVAPFPLQRFRDLMESYSGLGKTGEVLVAHWRDDKVRRGLTFLNHFREMERRQPDADCIALREQSPMQFPMTRALGQKDGDGWVLESSCREAYALWRWLPALGWGMVVKQDREEMMQPVEALKRQIVLASVVLFLFVVLLTYRRARLLSSPIERLRDSVVRDDINNHPISRVLEVNSLASAFQVYSEEVNERKEMLEQQSRELERSKQETDLIIEVMEQGLLVLNEEQRILRSNPKAVTLTGMGQRALFGKHIDELFDEQGQLCSTEGEKIPVRIARTQLQCTRQGAAEVVVLSDLREILDAENAIRANRAKDQFLAMMSHELRTPLTSIIGYSEMLNRLITDKLTEKESGMLHAITVSGRTQLTLINDILDLSKIEAGKFEIVDEEYSLDALIHELKDVFSLRTQEAGVGFEVVQTFQPRHKLVGDPVRIGQVLMNLLSNAVKFTEQGEVTLMVSLDSGSQQIWFEVKDTGFGMSPEVVKRLFRPFEQADSSITRKFGGTGLGLNISWNLVEMMGGDIAVESAEGVGSHFTVKLPFRPSEQRIDEEAERNAEERIQLRGTVLVVEDTQMIQLLVAEMIKRLGAEVVVADNGREGVDKGLAEEVDLVLMDKQMPVMSGVEATTALRKTGFSRPIYALTADVMKGTEEEMVAAGCDGVLSKPVEEKQLRRVLQRHLTAAD